jgi:hypothetical protein
LKTKQKAVRLGNGAAPAILSFPGTTKPKSILIVLPGGGVLYDKQWALKWLPLEDLPILRAYIDLPLHGERKVEDLRERYRKDSLTEFYVPSILGMSKEIPSIIHDLLKLTTNCSIESIGICGWSIGGLAAFLSAIEDNRIKALAGFAIPTGTKYLRVNRLSTDKKRLALLDKLNLITKAKALYPRSVLLMHGLKDDWVDPESSRSLYRILKPLYAGVPEKIRYVEYTNVSHDPCDSGVKALHAIREEICHWFEKTLLP